MPTVTEKPTSPPEKRDDTGDLTIDDWSNLDRDFFKKFEKAFEDRWLEVLLKLLRERAEPIETIMEKLLNKEIENNVQWVADWQRERVEGIEESEEER